MNKIFLLIAILAGYSCGSLSPHDNFKAHMSGAVGEHISNPHTWARVDRQLLVRVLDNGNMEHKYIFLRSCFYFFEVEKGSGKIIGWRFEGNEKDCVINP